MREQTQSRGIVAIQGQEMRIARIIGALALGLCTFAWAGGPGADAADGPVATRCSHDWPDDFSMQEYCAKRQKEGLTFWHNFEKSYGKKGVAGRILKKCHHDGNDLYGTDWNMAAYCLKQQAEAAKRLGKLRAKPTSGSARSAASR